MLVSCSDISKSFTGQALFHNLSLTINEGEKLGIIGRNGCGKSTLLSILGKRLDPDEGEVAKKKDLLLAFVDQDPSFDTDDAMAALESAAQKSRLNQDEQAKIISMISKQAELAAGKISEMSGGMKKRLAIACALVQAPDLIFFDEPTNHLDVKGIVWLEETLRSAQFAWVTITHDRWFLQRTTKRILEINRAYPKGYLIVEGDYRYFLEQKEIFLHAQARERDVLANKVRRETEWLHQGIKARGTRAKYREDQAYELMDKLGETKARLHETSTNITFTSSERKTKKLIELQGVSKSFGDKLIFKDLNLILSPKMRLGVLGENGSGKTTILKIMAQTLAVDSGTIKHAPDLKIAVFEQNRANINPEWTVHRALCEHGDSVIFNGQSLHIHGWAARFQIRADQLNSQVKDLSGGEQARLALAQIMLQPADVILLDEPTNDLDIPALEALEDSLTEFSGAIVLVTHDRYLIDRVCDSFIAIADDKQVIPYADYAQWEKIAISKKGTEKKVAKAVRKDDKPLKKKLTYTEQKEFAVIEDVILAAEEKLNECQNALNDSEKMSDPERALQITEDWQNAKKEVDRLYARWEELSEKA